MQIAGVGTDAFRLFAWLGNDSIDKYLVFLTSLGAEVNRHGQLIRGSSASFQP